MKFEIDVDRARCLGTGQCVHWAPRVFAQDDTETAIASVVDPHGDPEERVILAILGCPVQAISLSIDGVTLGAADFRNWIIGAHESSPVVDAIEQLSAEHFEIRSALTGSPDDTRDDSAPTLTDLIANHLGTEAQVYDAIEALIGADLVEAFREHHRRARAILAGIDASVEAAPPAAALDDLRTALDDLIRYEESVLFPATLSAIADRASKGDCDR